MLNPALVDYYAKSIYNKLKCSVHQEKALKMFDKMLEILAHKHGCVP
jgi:hypothetical protein